MSDNSENIGIGTSLNSGQRCLKSARGAAFCESQGIRDSMEDRMTLIDGFGGKNSLFAAVFDGHGGKEAAHLSADFLPRLFMECIAIDPLTSSVKGVHTGEAMLSAFVAMDNFLRTTMLERSAVDSCVKEKTGEYSDPLMRFKNTLCFPCSETPILSGVQLSSVTESREMVNVENLSGLMPHKTLSASRSPSHITSHGTGILDESGTTAVICFIQNEFSHRVLHCAHVGDSRAVICRGGRAYRLTTLTDHKPSCPTELTVINKNRGYVLDGRVNGRLAVSRALGDIPLKSNQYNDTDIVSPIPDISSIKLLECDLLLIIACDGLWDVFGDQEAVNFVLEKMQISRKENATDGLISLDEVESAARLIVQEALRKGSADNVSCMIILL